MEMRNIQFCLDYLVVADQQAYCKQPTKPASQDLDRRASMRGGLTNDKLEDIKEQENDQEQGSEYGSEGNLTDDESSSTSSMRPDEESEAEK